MLVSSPSAGTLDELRASVWLAEQARAIGLEPAGDDGTYFQFWPMRRIRIAGTSEVSLGGTPLELWKDVVVSGVTDGTVDLPLIYVGEGGDKDLVGVDLPGKAAAALIVRPPNAPNANVSLSAWRYALTAVRVQSQRLIAKGAAAVVLVADSVAESPSRRVAESPSRRSISPVSSRAEEVSGSIRLER